MLKNRLIIRCVSTFALLLFVGLLICYSVCRAATYCESDHRLKRPAVVVRSFFNSLPFIPLKVQNFSRPEQVIFIWHEEFTTKSNEYIERIRDRLPDHRLLVLCTYSGAENCIRKPNLFTKFIVLPELCDRSPLLQWVKEHIRYKLLSGPLYREQLLYAITLCTLWSYGGLVITPRAKLSHIDRISIINEDFMLRDVSCVRVRQKHSAIIYEIMKNFLDDYPSKRYELWSLRYNYHKRALQIAYFRKLRIVGTEYMNKSMPYTEYGALSFNSRLLFFSAGNIGDEIQTLVAIQYYPYLTDFFDRENLAQYAYEKSITVIMNSWLGDRRMRFPNSTNFRPILTSIHISGQWYNNSDTISYLQSHSPIGARDNHTLNLLTSLNVSSYLSGCATILLTNPHAYERTDEIYAVDVPRELLQSILPMEIYVRVIFLSHRSMAPSFTRTMEAFNHTFKYYAKAHIVITSRLHAAMPCVGMKTPVIFLRTTALPGSFSCQCKMRRDNQV